MSADHPTPWNHEPLDVDLRIVLSGHLSGWWTLERADHDGRTWREKCGLNSFQHCASKRLEPTTCVEGDVGELPVLLEAIKAWRGEDYYRRWAIKPDGDTALMWSPRNSEHSTRVTRRALEAMVAEYKSRTGGAE